MARGRFISNTLATSHKFKRLANDIHRLVYIMCLIQADEQGITEADPDIVAQRHMTFCAVTAQQARAALLDLHSAGLIKLYEAKGQPFMRIVDFEIHNKIRRGKNGNPLREGKSAHPSPTDKLPAFMESDDGTTAAETAQELRSDRAETASKGLRVKSKEQRVKSEGLRTHSSDSSELVVTPNGQVAQARRARVDYQEFVDVWNEQATTLPGVQKVNQARRRGIDKLCKEHGVAEALGLLHDAAAQVATDDFWIERQFGFDNLMPSKVVEKAEKLRNGRDGGNAKLAKEAVGWFEATHGN